MGFRAIATCLGAMVLLPVAGLAETPMLQSGMPVIHLADNLDEKDRLGWCIDTVGRGFAETLHAHSCKPARPEPRDTQFSHDPETGQIRSVAFKGKCMVLKTTGNEKAPFGLADCAPGDASQHFRHDGPSMELRTGSTSGKCVAIGAESRSAGPFMSRDLILADCATTDPQFKQWVIVD